MSAELKAFVKGLPAFERFNDRHLDALVERLDVRDYAGGHVFMTQGSACEAVQLILSGNIDITRRNPLTSMDEEIAESGGGEICCILALIEGLPATVTCSARGAVRSAGLSRKHYNELFLLAPALCHQFQYMLAVQMARDLQRLNSGLRDYAESFGDPTTIILAGKNWKAAS